MPKLLLAAALAVATLAPSAARAQFFLGARAGLVFPGGEVEKGDDLRDYSSAVLPVQVDLGLHLLQTLAVGAYAGVGYSVLASDYKDSCDALNTDCSGLNLRLGAQATLHAPFGLTKLWAGAFLGWEEQRYKSTAGGLTSESKLRGYEVGVQAGLDFRTLTPFKFGPYASASVGRFTTAATRGAEVPVDVADQADHRYFTLGIRGVFGL
jgi:hypothetical protein